MYKTRTNFCLLLLTCALIKITENKSVNCTLKNYNDLTCSNISVLSKFNIQFDLDLEPIKKLSIVDSNLITVPANFFDEKFENVTSLVFINAGIRKLNSRAFNNLRRLKHLQISFNSINKLPPKLFNKELVYLNLSNNNITNIDENVFLGMKKLRELILSNNYLEELSPNLTAECRFLKKFDVSYNKIRKIEATSLNTRLADINLSHNEISEIEKNSFTMLFQFKVDVSHNNLTVLYDYTFSTFLSSGINIFYAAHNKLKVIEKEAFKNAQYLEVIDLSYNELDDLSNKSLCGINSLIHLNLSHNWLRAEDIDLLVQCTKLEFLDMSYNNIAHLDVDFSKNFRLENIDLSNNHIEELNLGVFSGTNGLKVNLQSNNLKTLHGNTSDVFALNLSHNKIEKIESGTFINCTDLYSLDLSYNHISFIGKNAFGEFLEILHLQHNKIKTFDNWFVDGSSIWRLDLSYNEIETIQADAPFSSQRENHEVEVNLKKNDITKEKMESFAMDFIIKNQANSFLSISATLDSESCLNFQKKGDCINTKTEENGLCEIEIKKSGACTS